MAEQLKPNEICIVFIHGTFAPDAGWTKVESTTARYFKDKLGDSVHVTSFTWSGQNSQHARLEAGVQLEKKLIDLAGMYRNIYLLAHSHGGNVAIYATSQLGERVPIKGIITMGTPFISAKKRNIGDYCRRLKTGLILLFTGLSFVVGYISLITTIGIDEEPAVFPLAEKTISKIHDMILWVAEIVESTPIIGEVLSLTIVAVGVMLSLLLIPFLIFHLFRTAMPIVIDKSVYCIFKRLIKIRSNIHKAYKFQGSSSAPMLCGFVSLDEAALHLRITGLFSNLGNTITTIISFLWHIAAMILLFLRSGYGYILIMVCSFIYVAVMSAGPSFIVTFLLVGAVLMFGGWALEMLLAVGSVITLIILFTLPLFNLIFRFHKYSHGDINLYDNILLDIRTSIEPPDRPSAYSVIQVKDIDDINGLRHSRIYYSQDFLNKCCLFIQKYSEH